MSKNPLEGVRVIDFTHQVAGPFCTMLLGDMGADVIKIEAPGVLTGGRSYPYFGMSVFLALNRNKRSIVIDAKQKKGAEIIRRLVRKSDVFVENFAPGVASRLKLGYDSLARINPRLVYCSLSGFGSTGPYKSRMGWDPLVQAMSGIMSVTGEPGGNPVRCGVSLTDMTAGLYAAYGVSLALLERAKSGRGQFVEASLFDTAVSFMAYWLTNYDLTGVLPVPVGSGWPPFCPYQVFKTSDGWIFIGVNNNEGWKGLLDVLNMTQLLGDKRFSDNTERVSHKEELIQILQGEIRKWRLEELSRRLTVAGVASGPVNTVREVLENPHLKSREMIIELRHGESQRFRTAGIPLRLSNRQGGPGVGPPTPGNATSDILSLAGYSGAQIKGLRGHGIVA